MHHHIKKLIKLPYNIWYTVITKDGDDLTEIIKELIDGGSPFEFSNDYKKFRHLEDIFWK
jgi:hypothetical protein